MVSITDAGCSRSGWTKAARISRMPAVPPHFFNARTRVPCVNSAMRLSPLPAINDTVPRIASDRPDKNVPWTGTPIHRTRGNGRARVPRPATLGTAGLEVGSRARSRHPRGARLRGWRSTIPTAWGRGSAIAPHSERIGAEQQCAPLMQKAPAFDRSGFWHDLQGHPTGNDAVIKCVLLHRSMLSICLRNKS